jgi:hypothetical protein
MWIRFRFLSDADPGPDPSFQLKAQTLEKILKYAYVPYILGCHLPNDADPVPDPVYHFDADPNPGFYLMRIRIVLFYADPDVDPGYQNDPDPDPQQCFVFNSFPLIKVVDVSDI